MARRREEAIQAQERWRQGGDFVDRAMVVRDHVRRLADVLARRIADVRRLELRRAELSGMMVGDVRDVLVERGMGIVRDALEDTEEDIVRVMHIKARLERMEASLRAGAEVARVTRTSGCAPTGAGVDALCDAADDVLLVAEAEAEVARVLRRRPAELPG